MSRNFLGIGSKATKGAEGPPSGNTLEIQKTALWEIKTCKVHQINNRKKQLAEPGKQKAKSTVLARPQLTLSFQPRAKRPQQTLKEHSTGKIQTRPRFNALAAQFLGLAPNKAERPCLFWQPLNRCIIP